MQDILDKLNSEQLDCVKQTQGAVLVLAGAGSGKTRVLTHRVAYLINNSGVSPYNIIAITFTNKAAEEMKDRLINMLGDISGMWVCTIHSMCNRILRQFADRIGYTKAFSIYDEEDKRRVLKDIIKSNPDNDEKTDSLIKEVKGAISSAKNKNLTYEDCLENGYFGYNTKLFCDIYAEYERRLKKCNALDFDDLILKAYYLLNSDSECRQYFQDKFEYIHIDEFQDTNVLQYKLIKLLAFKHKNIFAVGDDDQSIYSFRGAEVENINRFTEDFADTKIFKLQQNYRSTKKILEVANCVIKNNSKRMEKKLWTENSEGVRAERYEAQDEQDEARYVSSMINSLVQYSGYKYSDFAVLIRLNALSRSFEQEFNFNAMPYRVFGGFRFYERKEIKDIIAYLRVVVNPFDEESLLRIINFPKRGIGLSSINFLRQAAAQSGESIYDIILNCDKLPSPLANKIDSFRKVITDIMKYSQLLGMKEFIEKVLEITNFIDAYQENNEENYNKILNIREFVNSFNEYFEKNEGADLESFLTSVTLVSDADEMDESGITVATVHAVKGLEFKTVFVCGLEDGIFPIGRAYNRSDDIEEERRLMYVAVTRAKERLYLTRAKSRYLYKDRSYMIESLFLRELEEIFPDSRKLQRNYSFRGETAQNISAAMPRQNKVNDESDISVFKEGSKIIHQKFGKGVIVSLSGEGSKAIADIAFPNIGIKTFTLKFAPIKLQ
jgi:DNA helicase-2/ATP-dependent DNA helicase PcrA